MPRVLVTGASGFIGQHLVSFLHSQGYWVRGLDLKPPMFGRTSADEFELMDLRSWPDCLRATKDVDEVYALAADSASCNDQSGASPTALGNDSVINSQSIEAARQNGVRRYLYVSSEHIYPEWMRTSTLALREEDALDPGERDPKGSANLLCEGLCLDFHKRYGLETRIVRIHDVYGPLAIWLGGQETMVARLCRKVYAAQLEGLQEIEIPGDGQQKGSFLYIDDCVSGLHKIMRSDCAVPVNVDHDRILSVCELADMVTGIARAQVTKRLVPELEVSGCCKLDTSLLERTVEWKPMSVEEGIKRTFRWVAEQVRDMASEFSFGLAHFPPAR